MKAYRNLTITFGLVSVPISIAPLFKEKTISTRLLCPSHLRPVSQKYYCDECGPVKPVKGFPIDDDEFVVMEDWEINQALKLSSPYIELKSAVPVNDIDPIFYESSYMTWPKDEPSGYAILRNALRDSKLACLGQARLMGKDRIVVMRWSDAVGSMIMHVCRFIEYVRQDDLAYIEKSIAKVGVPSEHASMAKKLLAAIKSSFDPSQYRDEYARELLSLIHNKLNSTSLPKTAGRNGASKSDDLLSALRESVEEFKNMKEAV